MREKKKDLHRQQGPLRVSSSSLWCLLRGSLDPIKPAYNQSQPDGRLKLTASTFDRLWISMPAMSKHSRKFKALHLTHQLHSIMIHQLTVDGGDAVKLAV